MSQSLVQIYVHIVYSTKNREPWLKDPELQQDLFAYLAGISHGQDSPAIKVGGHIDHVHLLVRLGKSVDISKLIRELKRDSSKWIKVRDSKLHPFLWQRGYGAFSINPSHVNPLTGYIEDQERHHRKESYQDEFRRLCRKYGVEIDERYCWD